MILKTWEPELEPIVAGVVGDGLGGFGRSLLEWLDLIAPLKCVLQRLGWLVLVWLVLVVARVNGLTGCSTEWRASVAGLIGVSLGDLRRSSP